MSKETARRLAAFGVTVGLVVFGFATQAEARDSGWNGTSKQFVVSGVR